jgi:PleD family two-component response regulator
MDSRVPEQDGDVTAVIRDADEALYNAKGTGRNTVSPFFPA